jgi:hypothetical protein
MKMLENNPRARLALYGVGLVALGALLVLNLANVIDSETTNKAFGMIATVANLLGLTGLSTAAANLNRQRSNGTLLISGTSAEQLAAAVRQFAVDEEARRKAVTEALGAIPGGNLIADAIRSSMGGELPSDTSAATPSDPASANYQP